MERDKKYNQINSNRENTFKVGHNKFSDLTDEELTEMLLDLSLFLPAISLAQTGGPPYTMADYGTGLSPIELDWRSVGVVNRI